MTRRGVVVRLLAAGFALALLAVGVFGIEVVFRLRNGIPVAGHQPVDTVGIGVTETFRHSDNPLLVYEPIPGAVSRYMFVRNEINSHGMRDREFDVRKRDGTFRTAVLGDSIVYGYGLEVEKTLAKSLERMLERREPGRYEVLSFGVPGYSTQQETELYRAKVRQFEPDLVVVVYTMNDEYETSLEVELFAGQVPSPLRKLFVVDSARTALRALVLGRIEELAVYRRETRVAEDFAHVARVMGEQRPVIAVFPYLLDGEGERMADRYRRIRAAAATQGFGHLELRDAFAGRTAESLRVFPDDIEHPNGLANRLAARSLLTFLDDARLLPPPPEPLAPEEARRSALHRTRRLRPPRRSPTTPRTYAVRPLRRSIDTAPLSPPGTMEFIARDGKCA